MRASGKPATVGTMAGFGERSGGQTSDQITTAVGQHPYVAGKVGHVAGALQRVFIDPGHAVLIDESMRARRAVYYRTAQHVSVTFDQCGEANRVSVLRHACKSYRHLVGSQ